MVFKLLSIKASRWEIWASIPIDTISINAVIINPFIFISISISFPILAYLGQLNPRNLFHCLSSLSDTNPQPNSI